MIRNIHPIGQGGFSSEFHEENESLFVYDCGVFPRGRAAKNLIKGALPQVPITGLFISHFDEDHISLIPELSKKHKIQALVLPLLSDVAKAVINSVLPAELATVILRPKDVFGSDIKVFRIKPFEAALETVGAVSLSDLAGGELESGQPIRCNSVWEYIPYNVFSQVRRQLLECACLAEGINLARLSDTDYASSHKKELRRLYKTLPGSINQNSMLVYSGADVSCFCEVMTVSGNDSIVWNKEACLFTGDYDFTQFAEVTKHLGKHRLERIGLAQIPHHGAWQSNVNIPLNIADENLWFVQFGTSNSFGHPSTAIVSKLEVGTWNKVLMVTENPSSLLRQLIRSTDNSRYYERKLFNGNGSVFHTGTKALAGSVNLASNRNEV